MTNFKERLYMLFFNQMHIEDIGLIGKLRLLFQKKCVVIDSSPYLVTKMTYKILDGNIVVLKIEETPTTIH